MPYTAAQKMQKETINNPEKMVYITFKDCIALSDGKMGVYIKPDDLIIDLGKIREARPAPEFAGEAMFNPEALRQRTTEAWIEAKGGNIIPICCYRSKDGKEVWIKAEYINFFESTARVYIEAPEKPVLITDGCKRPLGFILPFKYTV